MTTIFPDIDQFAAALPAVGTVLGLDLGTKTLGVAISDPLRRVASPLETIMRRKFTLDADRLLAIAAGRGATGFVLGLPINMDGAEGPRAQSTRAFARSLAGRSPLPIGFWDERMSTLAVERMLIGFDTSRKRRAEIVDKLAAAYILQGALDRLQFRAREELARASAGNDPA